MVMTKSNMNNIYELEMNQLSKGIVYLNYHEGDEVVAVPIKDMMNREMVTYLYGIENIKKAEESDDWDLGEYDLILNVVTDDFVKNENCIHILKIAKQHGKRIVSIIFNEKDNCQNTLGELVGESIYFSSLKENIEDYFLSALYYEAPFSSYIGNVSSKLEKILKPVFKGTIIPPELMIGDSDSVILAVGSMGYSTVRLWMEQGFQIKSKIVLVYKSVDADYGQPSNDMDIEKWCISLLNEEKSEGDKFLDFVKKEVRSWLDVNVGANKKMVIIGGLGKTTSSFLIPFIINQANSLDIQTSVVCTLPFHFESQNVHQLAKRSFNIIKKLSKCTVYYDGNREDAFMQESDLNLQGLFSLIGYGVGIAINEELDSNLNDKSAKQIFILPGNDTEQSRFETYGCYGKYNVCIG